MTVSELVNLILNVLECSKVPEFDGLVPLGNPLNWQADIAKLKQLGFTHSVSLEQGIASFST